MERLSLEITQVPTKVTLNVGGAANGLAPLERFVEDAAREFDSRS